MKTTERNNFEINLNSCSNPKHRAIITIYCSPKKYTRNILLQYNILFCWIIGIYLMKNDCYADGKYDFQLKLT